MKETCCNGLNKMYKIWENFDVKHSDISIKTITKNVINLWVYALQNVLKNEYKGWHQILGLRPCYKTRYKIWWPVVVSMEHTSIL